MLITRQSGHHAAPVDGYSTYAQGSAGDSDGYRATLDPGCENVYRRAEVDGRLATIEGVRCRDEHGDAYIVPESREIVEYHDER
ncbi:MAG: hypothetical protein ACNA7E_04405 [Wenzhouxiangellaceae bacterium]